MLSKEENELVTRVGPGTSMGKVIRRYWLPALLVDDLPKPDCPPVRVKLLGESLVAFRDTQGRIGLLEELCAHRCASLFLGRNEEGGLRCIYHGWKYDVEGQCIDMPTEPVESRFQDKVRLTAYPTVELGGVVWAYLGPPEKQPAPPDFEWLRAPVTHRHVSRTREEANYLQGIEGGIDTVHTTFLHNNNLSERTSISRYDTAPRLEVERTPYGFRYAGLRRTRQGGQYCRLYQFIMPFHQFRPAQIRLGGPDAGSPYSTPLVKGHMWVPIDDENTWVYNWMCSSDPAAALTTEFTTDEETSAGRGPDGETADGTRHRHRGNNWLIDREIQRTRTFTGITGLNTQDLAVQESMGAIVDRSRERLGTTDRAVIAARQIMLQAIKDLEAEDADPPGVDPTTYAHVHSTEGFLDEGQRWQDVLKKQLVAAW